MNNILSLILVVLIASLLQTNAQWFIIKKDYPSHLMNYPNPGKRSLPEEEVNIDCSIPYSYFNTYQDKTAWLLSCSDQKSPLTSMDDSSSSSSVSNEIYSSPRLISHERRTSRSSPPYFNEQHHAFYRRLLQRLWRSRNI